MKRTNHGFTNQQAIVVLMICFPIGLIVIGFIVTLLQRPTPQIVQPQHQPNQEKPEGQPMPNIPIPEKPDVPKRQKRVEPSTPLEPTPPALPVNPRPNPKPRNNAPEREEPLW